MRHLPAADSNKTSKVDEAVLPGLTATRCSGKELLISQLQLDVAIFDNNFVARHAGRSGRTQDLSRRNIEFCAMPRAAQGRSFDFTLGQGTSPMGACVTDCV